MGECSNCKNSEIVKLAGKLGFIVTENNAIAGLNDSLDYENNESMTLLRFYDKKTSPKKLSFVLDVSGEVRWHLKKAIKGVGKEGQEFRDPPREHGLKPNDERIYWDNNNWFELFPVIDGAIYDGEVVESIESGLDAARSYIDEGGESFGDE